MEKLINAYQNLSTIRESLNDAHAARRVAEEERNGLYEKAYLEELKGEADYRSLFVSRLTEEIARE